MPQNRPARRTLHVSADRGGKQIFFALAILFATIIGGTLGFVFIEGWSVGDSLYMTIISLTTTGFQEVRPLSPAGRILTSVVIITGIASLAYVGGRILQLAVERYLIRRGRMDRKIQRLKNHVILCGYGRMGRQVASDLNAAGVPFVIIEQEEASLSDLADTSFLHLIGDASSDEVLRQAGVDRARGLIAIVSTDAENVFTTLTAKSLNPRITVVARAIAEETEPKLRKAGADKVIKPYEMVGQRIAQLVIRPAMIEFVDTIARAGSGEISLEEIPVLASSPLSGVALRDSQIRSDLNIMVVAIRRGESELLYNPSADTVVQAGDRLTAIGKPGDLASLGSLCGLDGVE